MSGSPELTGWLRRLNVAMWVLAGSAVVVEAARRPGPFPAECLAWSAVAYCLCLLSFLFAHRLARRASRGPWVTLAMAVQLLMVLYLVGFWQGMSGGFLLVLTAWQGAMLWHLGRSLAWAGLQTLGLAALAAAGPTPATSLLTVAIIGGLQAFAVLSTHSSRREIEARLAAARATAEAQTLLQETVRDTERLRIARELHDGLGHQLTALSLTLQGALHRVDGRAHSDLLQAAGLTREALGELREVVVRLRSEGGFALCKRLQTLTDTIRQPEVHLELVGRIDELDAARAHALSRCAQELVTNVVKHAAARNLWVRVSVAEHAAELRVADDGQGASQLHEGHGLRGIRERVAMLGGVVEFRSARAGFSATVTLPLAGSA
jgi:signal transduction histidine kinase